MAPASQHCDPQPLHPDDLCPGDRHREGAKDLVPSFDRLHGPLHQLSGRANSDGARRAGLIWPVQSRVRCGATKLGCGRCAGRLVLRAAAATASPAASARANSAASRPATASSRAAAAARASAASSNTRPRAATSRACSSATAVPAESGTGTAPNTSTAPTLVLAAGDHQAMGHHKISAQAV